MSDSILPRTDIPYLVLDTAGTPVGWNGAAIEIFGDIELRGIQDIVLAEASPEDAARFKRFMSDANPFFSFDFPLKPNGGNGRWLRLMMSRFSEGGYLALFSDITEFRQRETKLLAAKESAERASISRSQFLANISHEIRTPIQTIIGMMELLDETKLDEEQTEYVRQVRFSADVMLTLINDVLDFSKVEAGQLKIEKIDYDLPDVIERSVDLVSMEAHKKELEVCIDISPELPAIANGDPSRLQQVILNLVKNAVKFTAKGHILVNARPSGSNVHFEVSDTGIGIKAEAQDKLFTQFFQADASTTRKYGGTGLGLAISRNIVELMGGSIGVRNNDKVGACFWFDIPLVKAAKQPVQEPLRLDPKTRFLIVDDNALALSVLCDMLVSMGFRDLTGAHSGGEALESLRTGRTAGKPYDIVLIDMVMPEMDGWRLAAEINKDRDINQAQLYLMVPEGSFGADAKMKLLEWFNGYLYKPIKRRKLSELLKEHWQSSIDLETVEELEPIGDEAGETEKQTPPKAAEPAPQEEAAQVESAEAELPARGITVLIAEDHPVNRKLLKIFLEKFGATVVTAEDGKEATERMDGSIDIVFMDIQMPRMNGYEATSWIRDSGYEIPVIACTASAQENEKEQCLHFGMTDILPKPYKKQDVIDILLKYARNGRKQTGAEQVEPAESAISGENPPNRDARNDAQTDAIIDPSLPAFTPDEFSEIMMGDIEAAKYLMGEFLEQTKAHMGILGEDIAGGRKEEASKTAHLIKGSSLNVTAHRLAAAALIIEKGAQTLPEAELLAAHDRMKCELELLEQTLKTEGYA
jgi:signal transduction histidine kinase/DNA-binding response OmpR family regulator/HPt (histidine-containing phosphotransfer) domain-containing protein